MTRRIALVAVVLAAVVAIGQLAYADDALSAEVPFTFVAAGRTYQPGRYEVRINDDLIGLTLVPTKGSAAPMLSLTRLAATGSDETDGRLVFDKIGETYILSEAWFPGADGFVLHVTKEAHSHKTINLFRRKQ
jgi:hypothetical protein